MSPIIRSATLDDKEAIIDLLQGHMEASWSRERWVRVLSTRWVGPDKPIEIGQVVLDDGRLVGFIGCVTADRVIMEHPVRTGSISSFYLLKPYRGCGLGKAMMLATTSNPEVTYTVTGASPNTEKMMLASGFSVLDRDRYIWRATGTANTSAVSIHENVWTIRDRLPAHQRRLLEDHEDINIRVIGIDGGGTLSLAFFSVKVKDEGVTYWSVLHLSDPEHFAKYVEALTDHLLEGNAVLACDRRYLGKDIDAQLEVLKAPHYFKSRTLAPRMIDHLYSEIVLLDLKMA